MSERLSIQPTDCTHTHNKALKFQILPCPQERMTCKWWTLPMKCCTWVSWESKQPESLHHVQWSSCQRAPKQVNLFRDFPFCGRKHYTWLYCHRCVIKAKPDQQHCKHPVVHSRGMWKQDRIKGT